MDFFLLLRVQGEKKIKNPCFNLSPSHLQMKSVIMSKLWLLIMIISLSYYEHILPIKCIAQLFFTYLMYLKYFGKGNWQNIVQ